MKASTLYCRVSINHIWVLFSVHSLQACNCLFVTAGQHIRHDSAVLVDEPLASKSVPGQSVVPKESVCVHLHGLSIRERIDTDWLIVMQFRVRTSGTLPGSHTTRHQSFLFREILNLSCFARTEQPTARCVTQRCCPDKWDNSRLSQSAIHFFCSRVKLDFRYVSRALSMSTSTDHTPVFCIEQVLLQVCCLKAYFIAQDISSCGRHTVDSLARCIHQGARASLSP